jgi:diaminopimelate decarboxylase
MFSNKDITQFADLETPFYYYDLALLQQTLESCAEAAKVHGLQVH